MKKHQVIEDNAPFGEVVQSDLYSWHIRCWKWNQTVPFGSLVCIKEAERTVIGIVAHIATHPIDQNRTAYAYQKTIDELEREQPHIFTMIQTTCTCITAGYIEQNMTRYVIPPTPVALHQFAYSAPSDTVESFLRISDYLHVLTAGEQKISALDELLLALCSRYKLYGSDTITPFLHTFSRVVGNDYQRLKLFVHRLENLS